MKIQELEQLVGTDRATIRFYEREGLIAPKRKENGYREYSSENAQELKKIRLLRQLGVSIDRIRSVQQGSEDFQKLLSQQIHTLTGQISNQKCARALCQTLRKDGAQYKDLDADYYLRLLSEIAAEDPTPASGDFQESVPEEIHPWRRFFARTLDYTLLTATVNFILIVLLRIRPLPDGFIDAVIVVLSGLLYIPVEALMLSRWGTTPGKYIFGIRVESIEGGNLKYSQAFLRAQSVYARGVWLWIPFLRIVGMLTQYCRLTGRSPRIFARYNEVNGPEKMHWDTECELSYDRWNWKRGITLAIVIFLTAALTMVSVGDGMRPKYRGDLTIAQFAENYNYYLEILDEDAPHEMLQPDGTKYPVRPNHVVIDLGSGEPYKPWQYQYTEENGFIKSITIQNQWKAMLSVAPMNLIIKPAFVILMAQEDLSIGDIADFGRELETYSTQPEGRFTFRERIRVEWSIQAVNCITYDGTVYYPQGENSTLDFWCVITILN